MSVELKAALQETSKVLVGIGEEWRFRDKVVKADPVYGQVYAEAEDSATWLVPYLDYHYQIHHTDPRTEAFRKLSELLADKDYFVISTVYDFDIPAAGFDPSRVVCPCGSEAYLQEKHNPAGQLYKASETPFFQELMGKIDKLLNKDCQLSEIDNVVYNNDEIIFNQKRREWIDEKYNESGYLPQWNAYQSWIPQTLGSDLLILELGVGLEYPTVIRFPFEKIAFINNKAYMIRVHEKLYQLTEAISKKAVSVPDNSMDFILKA